MKLDMLDKFFIKDDDDNLMLVNEINHSIEMAENGWLEFKGSMFYVDYENETIDKAKKPYVAQVSFNVENIEEVEE